MTTNLLSQSLADKVDNASPVNQLAKVGERLKEAQATGLIVQRVNVTAAANSTAKEFTVDYDMVLVDVLVRATATSASGTLTLRRSTTAITDAIACATDVNIDRAASITDAGQALVAGETLNLIANGANDRGEVFLIGYRT